MLNKAFGNFGFMNKALSGSWLKNTAIANNIANVNTPNYKKETVNFEDVLRSEINKSELMPMVKTNQGHMDLNSTSRFSIEKVNDTSYRIDDNNVDIDEENAELAKNTIYYNTLINEVNNQFSRLKASMKVTK